MALSLLRTLQKKLSIKLTVFRYNAKSFILVRTAYTRFRLHPMCHPPVRFNVKSKLKSYSSVVALSNITSLIKPSKSRSLLTIPSCPITYNIYRSFNSNNIHMNSKTFQNYHVKTTTKNKNMTVGVTGASGFVGSHCVQQLLLKGYTVNGTVTGNPSDHKYKWLYQLPSNGKLNLFKANLLQPNSFDEAFANCDYLFHVASPVDTNIKDPQKEMVDPAVKGTRNVLNACLKISRSGKSKLKRVILTSSTYALYGNPTDDYVYAEAEWNEDDTIESNAYAYSKTQAERLAFRWIQKNKSKIAFDLISLLPPLIIGSELNDRTKGMNAGDIAIATISRGIFTPINVMIPLVDVRDTAAAHMFFIEDKNGLKQRSGRYVVAAECMYLPSLFNKINEYSQIKMRHKNKVIIPRLYQSYAEKHENVTFDISNDKIKSLGFEFRNIDDTIRDTMHYLHGRKML